MRWLNRLSTAAAMGGQESRQMPCDRRVRFKRQANLLKARSLASGRSIGDVAFGKKAVQQQIRGGLSLNVNLHRAADQLAAAAQHAERMLFWAALDQQCLFRCAALVPKRNRLPCVKLNAFFAELAGDKMSQCEVHVVAAHEQVLAHCNPAQRQLATFLIDADERQIGRAAAYIANEQ